MKINNTIYITILFIGLLMSSCSREDSLDTIESEVVDYNWTVSSTTISVRVSDGRNYLENALVDIGDVIQPTDAKGISIIRNARRTALGYTIQISKEGYIPETIFISNDNSTSYISKNIELVVEAEFSRVSFEDTVIVNQVPGFGPALEFKLGQNSFVNSNGQDYNGNATVFSFVSDAQAMADERPLSAPLLRFKDGIQYIFRPTLRIDIYAKDDEGNDLYLKEKAELNVEFNSAVYADEKFNENLSTAKVSEVSGMYTLNSPFVESGDVLSGEIGSFGTYYLGNERKSFKLSLILETANSIPLAFFPVTQIIDGTSTKYITGPNGNLELDVPRSTSLILEASRCGQSHIFEINGIEEDSPLGVFNTDFNGAPITGTLKECINPEDVITYGTNDDEIVVNVLGDGSIVGTWICESGQDTILFTETISNTVLYVTSNTNLIGEDIDLGDLLFNCGTELGFCGQLLFDANDDGIGESATDVSKYFEPEVTTLTPGSSLGETQVALINEEGEYCFQLLEEGTYTFNFKLTPEAISKGLVFYSSGLGSIQISQDDETILELTTEVNFSNQRGDVFFNELSRGDITGSVSWDFNGDGLADDPREGMSIFLLSENQYTTENNFSLGESVTDATGRYSFVNVPNGKYVVEIRTDNETVIKDSDDSPDPFDEIDEEGNSMIPVFLQRSEIDADNNFIVFNGTGSFTNQISGQVLVDTTGDEIGDEGFGNQTLLLNLRDVNGLPMNSTLFTELEVLSADDGAFSFDNVPAGEYVITLTTEIGVGSLNTLGRISDKDETPESGEPLDTGPPDGYIWVNVVDGQKDEGNVFLLKEL